MIKKGYKGGKWKENEKNKEAVLTLAAGRKDPPSPLNSQNRHQSYQG